MKKQLRITKKGYRYEVQEKSLNTFFMWQNLDFFYSEELAREYFEEQIQKYKQSKAQPEVIEEITLE